MENLELLTDDEVSKLFKVEKNTIATWICRKQMPESIFIKVAGTRRFIKSRLEAWINGGLQEA